MIGPKHDLVSCPGPSSDGSAHHKHLPFDGNPDPCFACEKPVCRLCNIKREGQTFCIQCHRSNSLDRFEGCSYASMTADELRQEIAEKAPGGGYETLDKTTSVTELQELYCTVVQNLHIPDVSAVVQFPLMSPMNIVKMDGGNSYYESVINCPVCLKAPIRYTAIL